MLTQDEVQRIADKILRAERESCLVLDSHAQQYWTGATYGYRDLVRMLYGDEVVEQIMKIVIKVSTEAGHEFPYDTH